MKKFLLTMGALLIITPVMAKDIKVEALADFSTTNPPKTWQVKTLESFVADNGITVHQNTIITGKIEKVTAAKRLKRNASFRFVPKTYLDPQVGYSQNVKRYFEGKYSSRSELDVKLLQRKALFLLVIC